MVKNVSILMVEKVAHTLKIKLEWRHKSPRVAVLSKYSVKALILSEKKYPRENYGWEAYAKAVFQFLNKEHLKYMNAFPYEMCWEDVNAYPNIKLFENNEKETWKLKERKVQISRSGSGQMENDIYKIRILWSAKLGLQFSHSFKTEKDAETFARKITQKGVIRPEFWEKTFHPHPGWASAYYSD